MEVKVVTPDMAQDIIDYILVASGETANLLTTPEEFSVTKEQEEKFIQSMLDSRTSNMIVMMDNNKIVGQCGLHGRDNRKRVGHISSLGITILKSHWNRGIGRALMEAQIEYARQHGLSKINLEVRVDNEAAVHLYKKVGFEIEGINRAALSIDGELVDTYYMGILL